MDEEPLDLRETDRDGLLDLRRHIRGIWAPEDRARHASEATAAAVKAVRPTVPIDRTAVVMVGGLAGILLRKDVAAWLTLDLVDCWNSVRVTDPLPAERVRQLCNHAAARELERRSAA